MDKKKVLSEVEKAMLRDAIRRRRQTALIREFIRQKKERPKTALERVLDLFNRTLAVIGFRTKERS